MLQLEQIKALMPSSLLELLQEQSQTMQLTQQFSKQL
jgi:hypothetical protein